MTPPLGKRRIWEAMAPAWKAAQKAYIGPVTFRGLEILEKLLGWPTLGLGFRVNGATEWKAWACPGQIECHDKNWNPVPESADLCKETEWYTTSVSGCCTEVKGLLALASQIDMLISWSWKDIRGFPTIKQLGVNQPLSALSLSTRSSEGLTLASPAYFCPRQLISRQKLTSQRLLIVMAESMVRLSHILCTYRHLFNPTPRNQPCLLCLVFQFQWPQQLRMFKDGKELSDYEGNRSSSSLVDFAKQHEKLVATVCEICWGNWKMVITCHHYYWQCFDSDQVKLSCLMSWVVGICWDWQHACEKSGGGGRETLGKSWKKRPRGLETPNMVLRCRQIQKPKMARGL